MKRVSLCSCGCTEDHIVMERWTSDGLRVCLWSSGEVTDRLGSWLGPKRCVGNLDVARVMMGEVCLATRATIADLIAHAAQVARSRITDDAAIRAALDYVRRIGHVRPGVYWTGSIGVDGIVRVGRELRS